MGQDRNDHSIEGAERLIWSVRQEVLEAERKAERRTAIRDDADDVEAELADEDDLALAAFRNARHSYVGGGNRNPTLGNEYTTNEYYAAMRSWQNMRDYGVVTNFHAFRPQDKEAEGKENVGDTLDTRKVQGNLLVSFQGTKINMHVNISD